MKSCSAPLASRPNEYEFAIDTEEKTSNRMTESAANFLVKAPRPILYQITESHFQNNLKIGKKLMTDFF